MMRDFDMPGVQIRAAEIAIIAFMMALLLLSMPKVAWGAAGSDAAEATQAGFFSPQVIQEDHAARLILSMLDRLQTKNQILSLPPNVRSKAQAELASFASLAHSSLTKRYEMNPEHFGNY